MGLVTRGDKVKIPTDNRGIISTSVDLYDEEGNAMGFVQQFTRNDSRTVNRIRHLDSSDAGRIVELMPSPEEVNATLNGMAVYGASPQNRSAMLNRIAASRGGPFKSLNSNYIPFALLEEWVHPTNINERNHTYYLACLLSAYSHPVNIGAVQIAETATIAISYVED
jgi:hypothetical protein